MAAIWGVVTFEETDAVSEEQFEVINNVYSQKCHFDTVQMVSCEHARFACGVQWINVQDRNERICEYNKKQSIIMTVDCLLDNRAELCKELGLSEAVSDGTIIYEAYLRYQSEFAEHLRGIYAIAIWDEENKKLELISDHTAARCLYYCRQGTQMMFSTLLEPILAYFPKLKRNDNYEKDFLLADAGIIYVVPGETPLQEVCLMTPATHSVWEKSGKQSRTYWSPESEQPEIDEILKKCHSAEDYLAVFMDIYDKCVLDAIRSDANTGIAMSSGLDSASIGVLAARHLVDKGQKLFTYTYVPYLKLEEKQVGDFVLDESDLVKEIIADYPNMESYILNNGGQNVFSTMKDDLKILEMPFKNGLFANLREICTEAHKKHCKILLHGAYGNTSVSYGDIGHVGFDLYERKKFRQLGRMLFLNCRHQKKSFIKEYFKLIRMYQQAGEKSTIVNSHFVPDNGFLQPQILRGYDLEQRMSQNKHLSIWHRLMDAQSYHEFLNESGLMIYLGVFETKYGLQHQMVLRDPTKDMRVLHLCRYIPYSLFANDGIPRWLIRQGFKDKLPCSVLDNWNQRGRQIIDWLDLIVRDWSGIREQLISDIECYVTEDSIFSNYICRERLLEYIEQLNIYENANQYRMRDILALDNLLQFRKMYGNDRLR